MKTIKVVLNALGQALGLYFKSDMDVMSAETRKIFSNEEDKKLLIKAVDELRKHPDQEQTIILSNKEKITLVA